MSSRERRVEEWFEVPMLVVTVLLIFTLLTPLFFDLGPTYTALFALLNLLIWLAYYVELFTKLAVAKNKLHGLRRNWFLCFIAISPLFLPFRAIRLSRLISVFRLLGLQRYIKKMKKQVQELVYNVEYILITLGVFSILAALMMWQVESRFAGDITNLPDALWWAVITITTIGYGDIIPSSDQGKILGAIVSLMGTALFMVFVARVTTLFVDNKEYESLKRLIKEQNKS